MERAAGALSLLFLRIGGIFRLKRFFGGILRLSVEICGNIPLCGAAVFQPYPGN